MTPLLLQMALTPTAQAAGPVRLGVIVSTNAGLDDEEPLRFADSDGDQVTAMLEELAGFSGEHLVRVRNADRTALEDGLRRAVLQASALEGDGAEVELLVYYTGHAGADGLHLEGETLPLAELKAAARVVPASRRIFVVDACQSGQLMRSKGARLTEVGDAPEGFTPPHSEAWITSSGPEENAFEVDQRRGALFTHFFVSGARGAADADADGAVTLGELYTYAQQQTSTEAARQGKLQQPRWAGEHGDWTLTRPGDASTGLVAVGPVDEPLLVVRYDSQRVTAELPVGAGGRLALPSGKYQLVSVSRGRPRMADIVIGRREWREVELQRSLVRSAGIRARGGMLVRRPWRFGGGYTAGLGSQPGARDTHGGWLGVDRAVGRGNYVGLVVTASGGAMENTWARGRVMAAEARGAWTLAVVDRSWVVGPRLELGGGVLDQKGERNAAGPWEAWYGSASGATRQRVGFGRAEVGAHLTHPLGPLLGMLWIGGGAAVFGDVDRTTRPTASLRLGVGGTR